MEEQIKEVIETKIRPALQMDGGDIEFVALKGNIVQVHLRGACCGCPSAAMTLQHGVFRLLKEAIPSIEGVDPV